MGISVSGAAAILGRAGGRVRSERKAKAARENGKRGGGQRRVTNAQIEKFADGVVTAWRELSGAQEQAGK